MNKDYLASPFNDVIFKSTLESVSSISKNTEQISKLLQPSVDLINSLNSNTDLSNIVSGISQFNYSTQVAKDIGEFYKNSNIVQIQSIVKSYTNLMNLNTLSLAKIDYSKFSTSFESLIEEKLISTNEKIEPDNLPCNSKSKENIVTKAEKIQALQNAFFEFIISCKILKESLDHKVSYSFDRLLSNYGYSAALSSLTSLIKPNDPLFPITIFLITGIIQEIFRKK